MQKTSTKRVQDETWLGGKDDPLWIMQEILIWPYYQMVETRIHLGERDTQNSLEFWDTNRASNPGKMTGPHDNFFKKTDFVAKWTLPSR